MYKEQGSGQTDYKHLTWQDPDTEAKYPAFPEGRETKRDRDRNGGGGLAGRGGFHFISFQNYRINKPLKLREGRLLPKAKD